jgi:hypothetical protein
MSYLAGLKVRAKSHAVRISLTAYALSGIECAIFIPDPFGASEAFVNAVV